MGRIEDDLNIQRLAERVYRSHLDFLRAEFSVELGLVDGICDQSSRSLALVLCTEWLDGFLTASGIESIGTYVMVLLVGFLLTQAFCTGMGLRSLVFVILSGLILLIGYYLRYVPVLPGETEKYAILIIKLTILPVLLMDWASGKIRKNRDQDKAASLASSWSFAAIIVVASLLTLDLIFGFGREFNAIGNRLGYQKSFFKEGNALSFVLLLLLGGALRKGQPKMGAGVHLRMYRRFLPVAARIKVWPYSDGGGHTQLPIHQTAFKFFEGAICNFPFDCNSWRRGNSGC